MIAAPLYFQHVEQTLQKVWQRQLKTIDSVSDRLAQTLTRDGLIYVFGSGHSHLIAEEGFYRAGGLAQVSPIFDEPLMLHLSASASTLKERELGYAHEILGRYALESRDALIVISNSGRNAVPIEMAHQAREQGLFTLAITSLEHSQSIAARHPGGKRLFEVAEAVIDNGSAVGDAAVQVPGVNSAMGPTSTVIGAFLLHALTIEAAAKAARVGWKPAVYSSANAQTDTGNETLLARFQQRIRHL